MSHVAIVVSGHEDRATIDRVNGALKSLKTIDVRVVKTGEALYGHRFDTVLVDGEWAVPRRPGAWPVQQWFDQVLMSRVRRPEHVIHIGS